MCGVGWQYCDGIQVVWDEVNFPTQVYMLRHHSLTEGSNELTYEILFDEEFPEGLALRCSENRAYRLPPSCLLNISHGKRLEEEKKAQKLTGHTPRLVVSVL